ncbi:uridine kinase [Tardiphaga sp.]|uniref:uridine kinase n=1 Tax=Tardiphaga sp. TaxID=1926292 RepID=UPI00262E53E0|nr:uridine kinase [Tardiphaga sp.]MDB5621258.1 Uridine kinase [Tardiphaga sp.]
MNEPVEDRDQTALLIAEIAEAIRFHAAGSIVRVGVDGVDGVGKTVFADMLARAIASRGRPVIRASVDSFHNTRETRYRLGKTSPAGFYLESYNYPELRKVLLDPLGPGGSCVYCPASFDHAANTPVPERWSVADPDAVLVFDGIFLHRPELRDVWDLSIFLDAPFAITIPRGAGRGAAWGSADVDAVSNRRYIEGQRLYLREDEPQSRANIVIDYSDLTHPVITARRWPA